MNDELIARIARLYELAEFFAPTYAKEDAAAAWADIVEMLGAEAEADTRIAYQAGQMSLFEVEVSPV